MDGVVERSGVKSIVSEQTSEQMDTLCETRAGEEYAPRET